MTHKRFLILFSTLLLTVLSVVVLFNVVIDPYGLFGSSRMEGVNARKPMAGSRVRIVKPYEVLRTDPEVLITGNSRPELGLDPAHACWGMGRVYNLAIPGLGVHSQARILQSTLAEGGIKRVYWGLDFSDFLARHNDTVVDWVKISSSSDGRLKLTAEGKENSGYLRQKLIDMRDASLSLNALFDSIATLLSQGEAHGSDRRADGFNPALDYVAIVENEGQHVLFQQKNKSTLRSFARPGHGLYAPGTSWSSMLESVKQLLLMAQQADIEVVLFINPYHADYLTAIQLGDKWAMFEQWKRELLRLAESSPGTALWDFSAFDRYSTALPPGPGIKGKALEGYWEPAHYRRALGDLMIARMTDAAACDVAEPDFGMRLSRSNIDRHLAETVLARDDFIKRHPERIIALRRLARP